MSLPILQALCGIKSTIVQLFGKPELVEEQGLPIPQQRTLVPVYNPQGAIGAILLDAFVDEQDPLATPTVSPRYHDPVQLALSAPASNSGVIYFSQFPEVRTLTGITDFEGSNIIVNGDFSDGFNNWNNSYGFIDDSGTAKYEEDGVTDPSGTITLTREDSVNPPAGYYKLSALIGGAITNSGSTLVIELVVNGVSLIGDDFASGYVNTKEVTFYHDGITPLLISIVTNFTRDVDAGGAVDIDITVDDVSLTRVIESSLYVGTPINPGETHYIHKDDADINRIYVVGEGSGNYVIANYFYN